MFLAAHLALGLIIGKIFGNYPAALIAALMIDLDHLPVYIKNKVFSSSKSFWEAVTRPDDPFGYQRGYLHSIISWLVISTIALFISWEWGLVIAVSYLGHLFLDALDASDFDPFYPIKFSFRGIIQYYSIYEWIFTLTMFLFFLLLVLFL